MAEYYLLRVVTIRLKQQPDPIRQIPQQPKARLFNSIWQLNVIPKPKIFI